MLRKVSCDLFNKGEIIFGYGLNVILGDNDAKNSIGKSTALMVVDFAMGGNSLLKDKAGVIKALGHHRYNFEFNFGGVPYFFSRTTEFSNTVQICNDNYISVDEINIDAYTDMLKSKYEMGHLSSSFRSVAGPFSRIWNKGELDPEHPFAGDEKESEAVAVNRLIDIFEYTDEISGEKTVLDEQEKKKSIISKSMKAEIIPNINKTKYNENLKIISDNAQVIDGLKTGFNGALSAYEALFDAELRSTQQYVNELTHKKQKLLSRATRLERDIMGITPKLAANIALVQEFIPSVNTERLHKVEAFHQGICKLVGKELKKDLTNVKVEIDAITSEISELESIIRSSLAKKGTPDDLFKRVFELKEKTDKAVLENKYYETKVAATEQVKLTKERLNNIYNGIFLTIEHVLNFKLSNFNKVVYGPTRNPSQLRINSEKSYTFTSPEDTGTGKSYAGLVGFDLAMLSLTKLPFVIHDSVIYKNIEVPATRNILRILSTMNKKQIFLAFDEATKFGSKAERILISHSRLKLSDSSLLYIKDWREKSIIG
ncbi:MULTISPECIES: DUF2326 domain-containing protein [Dickeya]|uniref:DUF2326 domain-containing protein n=1 Tax=Dickeya lacustris TaxID=2259638 RepID=A0ABY8G5J2_9GAMM|nr:MULTISPECIES: DUF2326 domain-containing protein [Dickeya]WFN55198.1 DUF2326 domain-containing protein [Dickeya lacustris]WJM86492.1 DUF2326 domain-containing protein [Dickeya chrysanthemi]